jgi:hypothetical protein
LNASALARSRGLLSNIDRIYVSVQAGGAKPDTVALITGRFDDTSLADMHVDAASRAKIRNASAILVGDSASLAQVSGRMATLNSDDPFAKNAAGSAAQYDIWMMGSTALIPADMVQRPAGMPDFLSSVRSFSLGVSLSSDIRMEFVVDTTSAQVAAQIADFVRSGALQQPGFGDSSQNMRVNIQGTTVQIGMSMDQKQLSQLYPGAALPSRGVSGPLFTAEGQVNRNSKPNTVVISGLDGGPKEI